MKKVNIHSALTVLNIIAVASFIYVSCTDNVIPDTGIPDAPDSPDIALTDSIAGLADITEKEDSLSPRKYIYLTIDDAPLNGSAYIDSIIRVEKVKTNLFMVGNSIHGSYRFRKYHEQYEKNPYVEIYNHSYSHANNRYAAYYKNPANVLADFEKNRTDFKVEHKIARLPGRNLWQVGERKKNYRQTGATSSALLVENGYKVFGWDIEWEYNPKDYTPVQSIDELVEEIELLFEGASPTFTANHVVLLMHDQMFTKVNDGNDLGLLIRKLREYGYRFEYLRDYPEG